MIGETAQRAQAYQTFQAARQAQTLREIETTLTTTLDVAGLMDVLAQNLPRLGIPGCYLALYEDTQPDKYPQPAPEWSRLALAYTEQGRVELEPGGRRFRSCELAPEGMLLRERRYNLVVEPLYFRENQIGFVLFEVGPHEGTIYETLRAQISSALQGALLVRQVKSHALQLRTAAEVSRAASSILDLDELLPQMVNLIQQRFGLYYTGLFLMDAERRYAVLRAGTGDAGRQMMAREHKLALDENSMIGWCILNGQARIALDVGQDAVRFENPLLPETRSELALPLIARGQALGAVTVQSAREAAFGEADVTVLQTMADQVANAIANARLFEQTQAALAAAQQSEQLVRSVIDATPDWIFIKDREHRYRLANQGYAHALHITPESFIGKNDLELGFPEELVKGNTEKGLRGFWADDRLVMETGETQVYPNDPATIDGVVHHFHTIKTPLRDESGRVWGVLAFARDVTELERTTEALRQREAQMQETVREMERLYRATAREGWQALQSAAQLPEHYDFDPGKSLPATEAPPLPGPAHEPQVLASESQGQPVTSAPLSVRGQLIGTVGVYDEPERSLSPDELELVQQIAEQGALALESARLFTQTQTALNEARVLYQASTDLNAAQTYAEVLAALRRHTLLGLADVNVSINVFDLPWTGAKPPRYMEALARWPESPANVTRYELANFPAASWFRPDAPTLSSDIEHDPHLDENSRILGLRVFQGRSAIFAPLVVGGQWIGMVNAIWSQPRPFADAETRYLMTVVSQAATVMQNIRQLQVTQSNAQREQALRQITTTINASQDLASSLSELELQLHTLTPLDALMLFTHIPGDFEVVVHGLYTETAAGRLSRLMPAGIRLPVNRCGAGWAITQGRTRLDADVRTAPVFLEDEALLAEGLVSRLILPLRLGERVTGALYLASTQPGAFVDEHVSVLQSVAEQLALAQARVRLAQETPLALQQVEATHRRYLLQEWETYLAGMQAQGYLDGPLGTVPLDAAPHA